MSSANLEDLDSGSKPLTNLRECLMTQVKSMVAMTMILKGSSEAKDNLLTSRHSINNAKTTNVEISNIKQKMKMIIENEGNDNVAKLL